MDERDEQQYIEISGTVKGVIFQNEENGYTVLRLDVGGEEPVTVVGCLPFAASGEGLTAEGSWERHPSHGTQFKAVFAQRRLPVGERAIYAYLASGAVKGIGAATATLMVDKFGARTLEVLSETPEKLTEIKGITSRKARAFSEAFRRQAGIRTVNEISRCPDFESYLGMSRANFNIVLNHEARMAADDMAGRLQMPYLELMRLYQIDKIASQYKAFAAGIGATVDDSEYRAAAEEAVEGFVKRHPGLRVAVGEMSNANAFELALALTRYGITVPEIYSNVSKEDYVFIRRLAEVAPDTRLFTNLSPTMLYYDCSEAKADLTIGADAAHYHPDCPNVPWNGERQPFGYEAVRRLFTEMEAALA